MKIIPIAFNHCLIELENGAVLDVNDGSRNAIDGLYIRLEEKYKTQKNQSGKRVYLNTGTSDPFSVHLDIAEIDEDNPNDFTHKIQSIKGEIPNG